MASTTTPATAAAAESASAPAESTAAAAPPADRWEIFYHGLPNFTGKGRAEPLRLLLEDAGVTYTESNKNLYGPDGTMDAFRGSAENISAKDSQPVPLWAPPAVRHTPAGATGSEAAVYVHNSPAIMRYLGEVLGYAPAGLAARALCDSLVCNVVDFLAEGRASFHPVENKGTYYKQQKEAAEASKKFAAGRLRLIFAHLDKWIRAANARRHAATVAEGGCGGGGGSSGGEGDGDGAAREAGAAPDPTEFAGPVIGNAVSYADFYLFYFLDAAASQFGGEQYDGAWDNAPAAVRAYHAWFAARPRIAEYEASGRRKPWEGNSMM